MVFTDKINIVMHHSSQGMYKKNILSKSLNIEVFKTFGSVLLIFFLLVVGSRVVGYFEQAAEGNIDPGIIMQVIALRFPDFITLLIPLSFFLGVLITISRLYAEREIYGYFSAGLSSFNLVKYLAPQAIIYFCPTIILSLYIAPYTKSLSKEMLSVNSFEEQIESIKSNDLVTFDNGGFIYVKDAENNEIKGIKLLQLDKDNSYIVIADELIIDKNNDLDLNFKKGSFYGGLFSDSSQLVSNFNEFKLPLERDPNRINDLTLTKLFDFSSKSNNANFQWNISIPLTIIILLFYGVYISAVKPREGKFSAVLPGMLLYVAYLSLLILGRERIVDNPESSFNLWYIHLAFLIFLLFYIFRDKIIKNRISRTSLRESWFYKFLISLILVLIIFWLIM